MLIVWVDPYVFLTHIIGENMPDIQVVSMSKQSIQYSHDPNNTDSIELSKKELYNEK